MIPAHNERFQFLNDDYEIRVFSIETGFSARVFRNGLDIGKTWHFEYEPGDAHPDPIKAFCDAIRMEFEPQ